MQEFPRSVLFVSGERPERFDKAVAAGADLVCIDLEDAVHPDRRQAARASVIAYLESSPADAPLAVRINGLRTLDGLQDVLAFSRSTARARWLMLPKTESAQELGFLHAWLGARVQGLVALVETPAGIEAAAAIARARLDQAPSLAALMLGGADLSADLDAEFGWTGLRHARGALLQAARITGLQAWDVPFVELHAPERLREETERVRLLGFDCKAAIHPSQIPIIHAALTDSEANVVWATGLLQALDAEQVVAGSAFVYQGRMVDAPLLRRARRIAARHCLASSS